MQTSPPRQVRTWLALGLLAPIAACNAPESVQRASVAQETAAKELSAAWTTYHGARRELIGELTSYIEVAELRQQAQGQPDELQYWSDVRTRIQANPLGAGQYLPTNISDALKAGQV